MGEKKIDILIVDDEEQFLEGMKKRLELREFNVTAVNRGEKAVEAARGTKFDIALLDLKMPGMDGQATLQALKREHEFMEIVILTGHGSIDSAVETTKVGAYSYLQKPCDFESLILVLVEAYKKCVRNRTNMRMDKLDEILEAAGGSSPMSILKKLREIDEQSA